MESISLDQVLTFYTHMLPTTEPMITGILSGSVVPQNKKCRTH